MFRKKLRIIALFALVVSLAIGYILWRSVDKYVFDESGFYPLLGTKYPVSVGDTAKIGDDETYAVLQLGDYDDMSGEDTCVYVNDRDAIILTSNMCIIPAPGENGISFCRLSAFTDVQKNINNILIQGQNRQYLGDALLLYNGNDTYITLESATLTYGDKQVTLSPLSYVIVCRDQWVQYYDYSRDTFGYDHIEQGTSVEIKLKNYNLKIYADKDRGEYEGNEFMFFTSVNYLDDFFSLYY